MRPGIALVTAGTLVATGCQVAVAPAVAEEHPPALVAPAPHRHHVKHPTKPKRPTVTKRVAAKVKHRHHVTVRTVRHVSHGRIDLSWLPRDWQRIAMCESGGDPHQWTGSHYGLFQIQRGWFTGAGLDPESTTPAQQYALALRIYAKQGWRAWTCARIVGII